MNAPAPPGRALLDGRPVEVEPGETILRAARRLGVAIPTLCYLEGMPPEGGCRLCLVETGDGGRPRAACHTPLEPGMEVATSSPRLSELRREVLGLLLSAHEAGRFTPHASGNEIERVLAELGVAASPFGHPGRPDHGRLNRGRLAAVDESHPYLRFDPGLCILCRRCIAACEGIEGQFVYGVAGRGGASRLIIGPEASFADSACTACGACVDRCPTGAVTDRDRLGVPLATARVTESVCGECSVGCRVRVFTAEAPEYAAPRPGGGDRGGGPGARAQERSEVSDEACDGERREEGPRLSERAQRASSRAARSEAGSRPVGSDPATAEAPGPPERPGGTSAHGAIAAGPVLAIAPVPGAAVNRGHLCAKGRYTHTDREPADRLTRPLLRRGDGFEAIGWEEAVHWLAGGLAEIRRRHGPAALGLLTSSRSTNEAVYLLQKLFRLTLGTNNVDRCARLCHASTALALQLTTGAGAASASFADVERASLIVVAGANPTGTHPVAGARIKQAVLAGTPLLVIDPRATELAEYAGLHLAPLPGTHVALFNAMAQVLLTEGGWDRTYVARRCEGLDQLRTFLAGLSLEGAAAVTSVEEEEIRRGAHLLAAFRPALFVHGLGLSDPAQGTGPVLALTNLGMLTGSIGLSGAGMLPLLEPNNAQGSADMGALPDQVTGYQPVADPAVREHLERVWGQAPPAEAGLTASEMLEAAGCRQLRGLWIQGGDPAWSDAGEERVIQALEALDLLVVQERFLTETARRAHLVLPAASALEQDGTFTNAERRIQRVRAAAAPPAEARPDGQVALAVARALGESWSYDGPDQVMAEIAATAPHLFGGVTYPRLEGDGLQWPCPEPGHPGTATLHVEGFARGRGKLAVVEHRASPEPRG